jgi:hypothetical protein
MKLPPLAALLLAAPALAQDPGADIQARLDACLGAVDVDAIGARAEAFAAERGYEARVAELCAAGDDAGALAYARQVEDAFYAGDSDAARMRACLVEVLGEDAVAVEAVCDGQE